MIGTSMPEQSVPTVKVGEEADTDASLVEDPGVAVDKDPEDRTFAEPYTSRYNSLAVFLAQASETLITPAG